MKRFLFNKRSALFIIGLIFFQYIQAQILTPVSWSFSTKTLSDSESELVFTAIMEEGWHVYSQTVPEDGPNPTIFNIDKNTGFELIGNVQEPQAIEGFDPNFNMVVKYFAEKVEFRQRIKVKSSEPVTIIGYLTFMCCNDHTCIPPTDVDFSFSIDGVKSKDISAKPQVAQTIRIDSSRLVEKKKDTIPAATPETIAVVDSLPVQTVIQEPIAKEIAPAENTTTSLWLFFWLAFAGGLIAILTPCVFPMIPMTVSYFIKSGSKGKLHAIIYGLSIIVLYTLFGTIIAVTFGADFSNFISTHWLPNILFFLIFVVFAASFFGYFEIVMPSWLINKSTSAEDKGGIIGIIFMAFTLVLVSFSCTGPIVGTILVESVGGQVLKPIIGMLGFSLAFAIPFSLFALFPSWLNKMPKSGGWLNSVKVVLGFLELAFALKFLNIPDQTYHWGILDREVYLAFWIVIFTAMGFYLLGKIRFPHDSDYPVIRSFPRLILIICTFTFVLYLVPGMWGAPLKAISGWVPPMETQDFDINTIVRENAGSGGPVAKSGNLTEEPKYADKLKLPHGLQGYFEYEQALRVSKALNKPIFVDFTGHGCTNCREMENRVWSDPEVLKRLKENFVLLAMYVDDKTIELPQEEWYTNEKGRVVKLLGKKNADIQIKQFGANAQPYYVILDSEGKKLLPAKAYDLDINAFVHFLDEGAGLFKNKLIKQLK